MIEFKRSNFDGAHEYLQICRVGKPIYAECLERETPFVVQITAEPGGHGDFIGIYDLDGGRIDRFALGSWEIAEEVPEDVIAAVEQGWESRASVVERVAA